MTGWLPVSSCTSACVTGPEEPEAWLVRARRGAALTTALTGLAAGGPPDPAVARRVLSAAGLTLEISGDPTPSAAGTLFVANHVSWLDDVALMAVLPGARPVAKAEIAGWPLIGAWARRSDAVFLDRSSPRRLPGTVAEVAGILRAGGSVVLHPEGTTGCGAELGRFRRAFFQAAIDADADVRPIALRYRVPDGSGTPVPGYVGGVSLRSSLQRILAARGLVLEVHFLPPLPREPDRRRLAARAERAVAAVTEARAWPPTPHPRRGRPAGDPVDRVPAAGIAA